MRIWDIHPGYLNNQSLLGEHRELHGIVSIIACGKKCSSKHPETIRWVGFGWALRMRHQLLASEMAVRSFSDNSPVLTRSNKGVWPKEYIDEPAGQFTILTSKYQNKEQGRIPLPGNTQQLWSQHKYSVLARNVTLYKKIGRDISDTASSTYSFPVLAKMLTELLRTPPSMGGIKNALQHMWGYVSDCTTLSNKNVANWSLSRLLAETQQRVMRTQQSYLMSSTALSELKVWMREE